jgi:hypothetical protein
VFDCSARSARIALCLIARSARCDVRRVAAVCVGSRCRLKPEIASGRSGLNDEAEPCERVNRMLKVSVVIPVYNPGDDFTPCIDSLTSWSPARQDTVSEPDRTR